MISKKEIKHIAKLSRIGLKEKEIESMKKDFFEILNYIDLLKEIDEEAKKREEKNNLSLREDNSKEKDSEVIKRLVNCSPKKEKKYLKVKSIFK